MTTLRVLCFIALVGVTLSQAPPPPPLPPVDEVCEDYNPACPTWKHLCNDPMNSFYMKENCKETCDLCPKCEDKQPQLCQKWKSDCSNPSHADFMKITCPATCKYCKPKTTEAPPTIPPYTEGPTGPCGVVSVRGSRVINGVDAKPGAWPWQVLIKLFDQPHCGGSIVSPWYIVTAAHCLYKKEAITDQFSVVTGEHDFDKQEGPEMTIPADKLIVHPKFNFDHLDFDIALIKLKWPVQFKPGVTATVCMPKKGEKLPVGTNCMITGWGKTDGYAHMHHILQQARLPVVDNQKCNSLNKNNTRIAVSSNMVCAGFGPGTPTGGCHGDSGGPFVCNNKGRWYLQGAVSWGSGKCDTSEAYTVFSRISEYRDWIDVNMK